ncbi:DUF535 family protein [Glaciimonas sp. PCH181]|uniref:DUF535 family protein n=1 Tax=Glaciimonas sp. PCH181 TaxID=2133943 RepID=UPI001374C59B|nr:DUF535 family protein [Glaciimonas sp. PCH181]
MSRFFYPHQLRVALNASAGFLSGLFLMVLAIAEWDIYLVPASLAALWYRCDKVTRVKTLKASAATIAAVLVSEAITQFWKYTHPEAEAASSIVYESFNSYGLSPTLAIAITLAAGLSLWAAKAMQSRWFGVLLLSLSLAAAWARIFLGMYYPLDIIEAGIVALTMMLAANSHPGNVINQRFFSLVEGARKLLMQHSALVRLLSWSPVVVGHTCPSTPRIDLQTGLSSPQPSLSYFARRIRMGVRTLLYYHETHRWLTYWNSSPLHAKLASATPKLLQKIYRPYQSNRLRSLDRLSMLISHYNFVLAHGLAPLVLRAAESPLILGCINGKSGTVYSIELSSIATLDREGELALNLFVDQQRLFSVAFTFYGDNLQPCVGIGCLQGPRGSDAQDRVRFATRDMFGMRPKSLMVRLVREIGKAYGCQHLILVSNRNRVMQQQMRTGQIFANYDEFWRELGAMSRTDGDFQLSCSDIPDINLEQLASSKRSEARKRIALIQSAVATTVHTLRNF